FKHPYVRLRLGRQETIRTKQRSQPGQPVPLLSPMRDSHDADTEHDSGSRPLSRTGSTPQGEGDDDLSEVQDELLYRSPKEQPDEQHDEVHPDQSPQGRYALAAVKDLGDAETGASGHRGHKGEDGEEHVDGGKHGGR